MICWNEPLVINDFLNETVLKAKNEFYQIIFQYLIILFVDKKCRQQVYIASRSNWKLHFFLKSMLTNRFIGD